MGNEYLQRHRRGNRKADLYSKVRNDLVLIGGQSILKTKIF